MHGQANIKCELLHWNFWRRR